MKLNIKITLPVFFCLSLIFYQGTRAQSFQGQSELNTARKSFNSLEYISAIAKLKKFLAKDTSNLEAMEMLAYSYRMTKNYPAALESYRKLTDRSPVKNVWALYYAESLANNQQYEESERWYRKYLSSVPADKRAAAFASTNLGNINKNPGHWQVGFLNINSQASEYSPAFYKEGLLFSSNRQSEHFSKHIFKWDNTPFSKLYYAEKLEDLKVINPDSLVNTKSSQKQKIRYNDDDTPETSNDNNILSAYGRSIERDTLNLMYGQDKIVKKLGGVFDNKYHNAAAAVFPDGAIIFTRNNYINGKTSKSTDGTIKLKMYTAYGPNLNSIKEFPFNSNEYSTGHPALSPEGNILVFTSDRPGGFGGTDLYYCVKSGQGEWTSPVNLGKQINTEGNEMFPSFDHDGNLFFSSTGLAGLGGLDVFQVQLREMKPVSHPINMGSPINSSKDDFALIITTDGKKGYFSSNRNGNDNIYEFRRSSYKIILQGTLSDARTRIPLAGGRILMHHLDGNDTIKTDNKGRFRRELPAETDYEITAQKLGYINNIQFTTSVGIQKDSVINLDIRLSKTESAQQYILNHCDSLKKVFSVKNIYYDLDRSEIRSDAKGALNELADLMRKYPEITVITSSHCDSRASEEYNRNLSLRRGESAKTYLVSRGIRSERIKVEYYGKTRLVNRCYDGVNCSEEDQQLNRRTEFDVILQGVNITRENCSDK
ncbi:OmpA family protein [Pedobacter psychrodurus]|uniref:OmpA family protein n=1 Tax=Pedobacter psychrodurus TaxID=2530456 RepID=UPI002930AF41|nr:OmpA family protein [Pedobacter psychrodurus]